MNITEFRAKYPQYSDMDDMQLSAALHRKHYSDIPLDEFNRQFIGTQQEENKRKWKTIGGDEDLNLKPAVLYKGQQLTDGERHDDILENNGLDMDMGARGFQTPDGKFLSRNGGMQYIEKYQPLVAQRLKELGVDELHSQDLSKAYDYVG